MKAPQLLLWTLVLVGTAGLGRSAKLNLPRVLLPIFRTLSVNFSLEVKEHDNDCFTWSTPRSDLISIFAEDGDGCSTKAKISVVTHERIRSSTIVIAKGRGRNTSLRADVHVAPIHSLGIFTTSRLLYMEENPEIFEVRAYDDQENSFSTLEGVEFQWLLHGGPQVLKFMTFADSPYDEPSSIALLERQGLMGSIVLLESVRTGSTKVSVQLPYSEYRHVPKVEVTLRVIDNLLLQPREAFIMKGDTIKLHIAQERQGRVVELEMSMLRFSLSSENPAIASVEGNAVIGHSYGTVKIILHDKSAPDAASELYSMSSITVSLPYYLTLTMSPYNNWMLLSQQQATIIVDVFDKDDNKFLIGENAKIKTTFTNNVFGVTSTRPNGSEILGYGQTPGTGEVFSTLHSSSLDAKTDLTASASLLVYPAINIAPKRLVLPWDETSSRSFRPRFRAVGGDGSFSWHTSNVTVAGVTETGIAHILGPGSTLVYTCAATDPNCYAKATAELFVLEPTHIEIEHNIHEAVVGQPIHLYVGLSSHVVGPDGRIVKYRINDCQHLSFRVGIHDSFAHNFNNTVKPLGSACATLEVVGSLAERSQVTVSLKTSISDLKATSVVAAYDPLVPLHPSPGKAAVLALATSRYIVFSNGPSMTLGNVFSAVTVDERIVRFEPHLTRQPFYVYSISCIRHGETTFNLTLTTNPLIPNCKGIQLEASVDINCAYPSHMMLQSFKDSSCPAKLTENMYTRHFGAVKMKVVLSDHIGRVFDNATSLKFDWSVERKEMAYFEEPSTVNLDEEDHDSFVLPLDHFKFVNTRNVSGTLVVGGKVIGYRKEILDKMNVHPPRDQTSAVSSFLEATNIINIVNQTVVEPRTVSVVNHPNNVVTLLISNGSGYYDFDIRPKSVASYTYDRPRLSIVPLLEGQGMLSIRDLCVPGIPTVAVINVLKVALLKVEIPEKVLLKDVFTATVRLMDGNEKFLPFTSVDSSELEIPAIFGKGDVLKIESWDSSPKNRGMVTFKLRATAIGETTVVFKYLEISSQVMNVQVFQPISIVPHELTLTVGAEVQVEVVGGPQPDPGVVFTVGDTQVISVAPNGVVKGLQSGRSSLTASAMGPQGQVYSKDTIEVHVVLLTGVRITAPISRLGVQNTMPLWASGVPNSLSPFILGSVTPPLIFKWSVSPSNVAQLKDPLQDANLEVRNEDRLSVRLRGLKSGHAQVQLSVSGRNQDRSPFVFNSTLDIEVFDHLQWTKPWAGPLPLIVAPKTDFQIETNIVAESSVRLSAVTVPDQDSLGFSSTPVLEVTDTGLVTTNTKSGNAIIMARLSDKLHSQQAITLNVAVKEVQYIMINVMNVLETKNVVHSLPQGLVLKLNITYHDLYGSIFYAAPSSLRVDANLFDKIHESKKLNNVISVNVERPGSISLRVRDKSKLSLEDFIKLPVENHISPNKFYMSLDEIVCFSVTTGGKGGVWTSEKNAITVDETGLAHASKIGSSVVSYVVQTQKSSISTSASFEVLPVQSVLLKDLNPEPLTNKAAGSKYKVLVQLVNEKQSKVLPLLCKYCQPCDPKAALPIQPPFKCEMQYTSKEPFPPLESLFSVMAIFDRESGSYACEITALTGPSLNTSTIDSDISLRVDHVPNSSSSPSGITSSLTLNFAPAFHTIVTRLFFNRERTSSWLVVVGTRKVLDNLQVESDSGLINIGVMKQRADSNLYEVSLDKYFWSRSYSLIPSSDIFVIIYSPLLKQTLKVPVFVDEVDDLLPGGHVVRPDSQWPFQFNVLCALIENPTIVSAIICLIVVAIAVKFVMNSSGTPNSAEDVYREMSSWQQAKVQRECDSPARFPAHQIFYE
ncbi:Nuclear pore membrane glycoprotein [Nesidiocoris tenuis]|uniref:Nuclear pore membrane glycoprotein n=1 Tax=Nesidiocoris tenuis TaxID=355587 RepID=A0ABN7A902_9HEMI|nr:Nuclear pore membrane glycoprotein [Nesidiocoris tenuis]